MSPMIGTDVLDCCYRGFPNPMPEPVGKEYVCSQGHVWVVAEVAQGKYWQSAENDNLRWGGPAGTVRSGT